MHNFEIYRRQTAQHRPASPTVTVQRRGQISLNPAAMKALGRPEAIVFLVDRDERLLGFRATGVAKRDGRRKADGDGALVRAPGATVAARPVLKYMEADLSASRRYTLIELDGVQCIDLKVPGVLVTSNRRKP